MSVTTRQSFRNTFGSSVPVIAPMYSARCETWAINEDGMFKCGSNADCELRLVMPGIESLHCSFQLQNGTLTIRRERGRVWVNDIPVGSEAFLCQGDVLTLGPVSFSIEQNERTVPIAFQPANPIQTPIAIATAIQHASALANAGLLVAAAESARLDSPHTAPAAATTQNEDLLKAIENRERQLQERLTVIEERERLISERQLAHDERARFLSEQRSVVEQQQSSVATTEAAVRHQKDDIENRLRTLLDREQKLARQMEDSAAAYAQLELTRSRLSDEFDKIAQREAALTERSSELTRISKEQEERQVQLMSEHTASSQLKQDLDVRRQQLEEESQRLARRDAEIQQLAAELETQRASSISAASADSAELHALRQKLSERDHILAEQRSQLADLQERVRTEHEQSESLRCNFEQSRQELTSHTSAASELSIKLAESESLISTLRDQVAYQTQQLETLQVQRNSDLNANPETRTVGQLAAIASEREAALRAKQEAFVIQTQVREAKEKLAADESRLQKWQAEVDSRYLELADRLVHIKATLRNSESQAVRTAAAAASSEAMTAERDAITAERAAISADRALLQSDRDQLAHREAELRTAESRLNELQEAARAMHHAAEAEREALQASHKNLLFERNAHQQRNQDLQSRETGLHEREIHVARQTEELRSRFDAINQQTAELRRYDGELNSRAAELHRRILDWKSESKAEQHSAASGDPRPFTSAQGNSSGNSLTLGQLTEELRDLESQNQSLMSEREALMTAIRELQKALQDARADVEEASRIKSASAKQEQTIAQLYQQIEERSNLLQLSESRFHQVLEELEETRRLVKESQSLHSDQGSDVAAAMPSTDGSSHPGDELEAQLLGQIESLRTELNHSAEQNSSRQSEYSSLITERDARIHELESTIQSLEAEFEEKLNTSTSPVAEAQSADLIELDTLRVRLEQAEHVVQDRDDLIRELRSRLMQQSRTQQADDAGEATPTADRESLQNEARELDRRAQLLDHREEELRERSRRLDQTEEEVESQRRQLLDARQQLEIARAEIQVAMKQHSTAPAADLVPMQETSGSSPFAPKGFGVESDHGYGREAGDGGSASFSFAPPAATTEESGSGSGDLRSELASLFGLKKSAPEAPAPRPASGPLVSISDFVDLTEPSGQSQSVALKFGEDASTLVSSVAASPSVEQEPEREENSDDFVRDYMEQLLARSRKSAGNALPEELKSNETKAKAGSSPQPVAAPVKKSEPASSAKKEGPKVKSFIEQYMAGGFGDLTGEGTFPQSANAPAEEATRIDSDEPAEPRQPRQKIDLQKLREDMDSFRTLSTQSVENALVDHAIRKERHSINGRIMFVAVLIFMTIFLAIANAKGIINQPSLVWVTLVAAIGAAAELGRKYVSLKARCRVGLQGESDAETPTEEMSKSSDDEEARRILAEEKAVQVAVDSPKRVATLELDEELPHHQSEQRFLMQPDDEQERSRYFEL